MTPQKASEKSAAASSAASRKPWKKKTPLEVVLQQGEALRRLIVEREQELVELRQQYKKFEQARQIFEA
jgi:hypothetical protein